MAAHRYWRIYNRYSPAGTNIVGFSECEMRTAVSGADQTGSGTASASAARSGEGAANAFDNNTSTIWQADAASPAAGVWLAYDFGAGNDKDIVEIALTPVSGQTGRAFQEFDIQWSDDNSAWTTAWSVTFTAWSSGTASAFAAPSAVASRHWRLRADALVSGNTMSCAELEMRETHGGADQTGSGTASARTTYSGYPASQAFDNNTTTLWSGNAGVADCEWLAYDFGSAVTKDIQQLYFTSRNDANYTQSPTAGWIESSADGISWLNRKTFSGITWTQGSSNTIDVVAPAGGRRRHAALLV